MSPDSELPARIARFEVVGLLGKGGMGQVYLARDPRLGREVALKVLPHEYATDVERLERFRREARVASALNHPHICTIHDIGEEDGRPYIVMERVDGETLAAAPIGIERALHVGGQVARALSAAHAAGVVHRDIKPTNIMVRADGYAKVVDFGLARSATSPGSADAALTEVGTLVGTVRYMSPEQARGLELEGASDVFSLGVVLYELVTGTHPFQADTHADLIQAILSHRPVPADRVDPQVPAALAGLLQHMLAADPSARPSAGDVAVALERAHAGQLPRSAGIRPVTARHTVGRQGERDQLVDAFDRAADGRGLFACVTGEPGIGKTTLVDDFLATLSDEGRAFRVAQGRCSERLAGTEAYLPILEALEGLVRDKGGDAAARTMRSIAPSWYAQIAPIAEDDSSLLRALQEGEGVTQQRLKRELGAFLVELSRHEPLIVLLDDIHWADSATVDLLAFLGARCADKRVLFLVTYRPTDLALAKHPFGSLKLDLQSRGVCREIPVGFLSRDDVERYTDLEFPGNDFPKALGDLIHARTEGSPLFMVDLLRYLRDEQVLVHAEGRWTLGRSLPDLEDRLPESVKSMVQRKVEQLGEEERTLLVACSVQGCEFDAAVVAEALGLDAADVEERLDELDRVHRFVGEVEEHEYPDRTLTMRYRFVHALYQNALFATLRPTRRASLCRAVANSILSHHGEENDRVAAEVALLLEGARDFERAIHFFLQAARHAVRVFANHEAARLARRGLELVRALPASEERDKTELALLVTLGPPLKDTEGWAAPEVNEVYARANELGERIGGTPDLFPALWGMWLTYSSTADMQIVRSMCDRLLDLAEKSGDSGHRLQAHHALTTTHYVCGKFAETLQHADEAASLYDEAEHRDHAFLYGGHDPGSCCSSFAAQSLWMLGYPDRSLDRARHALRMAEKRAHPVSMVLARWCLGVLHQHRREVAPARMHAEACRTINLEQGAPIFPSVLLGWVESEEGDPEAGIARIGQQLAQSERVPLWWVTYFCALYAEVLAKAGRHEEAVESTRRAFELSGDGRIGSYHAELHRLQGVSLIAMDPSRAGEAEQAFQSALECARRQNARMLELRTLTSLARLRVDQGRASEIRPVLASCYDWFTEGFDTADLKDAKALLDSIS